jgi:LysR family transcriptional regulator, glycine cleavage system transcriptional activator
MAFEAVDRLGTASAAAEELSLTQGAISRALQRWSTAWRPASDRERQRLRLTPAGRDYVAEVRKALHLLASTARLARQPLPGAA